MKRSAGTLLRVLGVTAGARALLRRRAVVLTYHGVLASGPEGYDYLNQNFIHATVFERQMRWLQAHYQPLSLTDLVGCLRGHQPLPERAVCVTFDDGFANNCSVAFPILQRLRMPFTVFLATGLLDRPGSMLWTERVKRSIYLCDTRDLTLTLPGREIRSTLQTESARAETARQVVLHLKRLPVPVRDTCLQEIEERCGIPPLGPADAERFAFLTWDQVRSMHAAGVAFGGHTVTHPILSTLDADRLAFELTGCKDRIEAETGAPCAHFAYPNGSADDFGAREKAALTRAGFEAAFSLSESLVPERPDLFAIDRINVNRDLDDVTFEMAMAGLLTLARDVRGRLTGAARSARLRPAEAR